MIAPPQFLTKLADPWANAYSHSKVLVAAVTFLGILLVSSVLGHALTENHGGGHSLLGLLDVPALPLYVRDLIFEGRSAHASMVLDSAGMAGPSPVQTLAFALAGCMGMDVVYILKKGRLDLQGLKVSLTAERAQEDPHRITALTIDFTVTGDVPKAQIQRAIYLSQEKYCSVWHSMRQDIPFTTTISVGTVS